MHDLKSSMDNINAAKISFDDVEFNESVSISFNPNLICFKL